MDAEIREVLMRHLKAIQENDTAAYHETTSVDLSLYEWWITPHRIDGLSGATITSNAITRLVQFWLSDDGYGRWLKSFREGRA